MRLCFGRPWLSAAIHFESGVHFRYCRGDRLAAHPRHLRHPTTTQRTSAQPSQRSTLALIEQRAQLPQHLPHAGLVELHTPTLAAPPTTA